MKFCGNCGADMTAPAGKPCVKCGQPVPAGHKFCGNCGTTQEVVCASCNTANPGNLKFCGNCGKPLSSG
ncbi:MAG TPA: zinc ribbon domain-containing protein, partial [Thermoplasmata archaeon]